MGDKTDARCAGHIALFHRGNGGKFVDHNVVQTQRLQLHRQCTSHLMLTGGGGQGFHLRIALAGDSQVAKEALG
ncbi:hypothetical protein D3C76_1150490 [compost metagenome]